MELKPTAMFSYKPTQARLKKQRDAILRACKSDNGRTWMARWPWLDLPAEAEDAPRRRSDHELKNVVKVTTRYLFSSPWIPELLFVVGRLDQAVLDMFSRERVEVCRSNQGACVHVWHAEGKCREDSLTRQCVGDGKRRSAPWEVDQPWQPWRT